MVMRHIVILLALFCASCSSALPSLKPYQMDIQQGNVVTSKMMLQLRPGMTKSQVRFIMGTPLIQDSFHSNRWDYFYQMRHEGKVIEQRRVILEFENDALVRVRGDVIPVGEG
jgi:outer membrane protein assembly factor BamE